MNTQTLTIQEFQRMMQSDDKKLPEVFKKVAEMAKPMQIRALEQEKLKGLTWGWAW